MGVYIKGMEMPKSGTYEVSIDTTNGKDKTIMSMFVRGAGGLICCGVYELVPVPPHGRLIDADALRAKQQEDADLFQGSTAYCDKCRRDEAMNAVANIVNAPTILEAEEGET